jgi:hypothetical protein
MILDLHARIANIARVFEHRTEDLSGWDCTRWTNSSRSDKVKTVFPEIGRENN